MFFGSIEHTGDFIVLQFKIATVHFHLTQPDLRFSGITKGARFPS